VDQQKDEALSRLIRRRSYFLNVIPMSEESETSDHIELKRRLGTCCPEPSCDYTWWRSDRNCQGCGAPCKDCTVGSEKHRPLNPEDTDEDQ